MIEDCYYFFGFIEKVKLFGIISFCDDLTVLMNCYETLGYKRKRKGVRGKISVYYYYCLGSIIQSRWKYYAFPVFAFFSSYTINTSRRFNPWGVTVAIPVVSAHTLGHHQGACVVLGCRFQDETPKHQWFLCSVFGCIVFVHTRISVHDACYGCKSCCSISDWDTVE